MTEIEKYRQKVLDRIERFIDAPPGLDEPQKALINALVEHIKRVPTEPEDACAECYVLGHICQGHTPERNRIEKIDWYVKPDNGYLNALTSKINEVIDHLNEEIKK